MAAPPEPTPNTPLTPFYPKGPDGQPITPPVTPGGFNPMDIFLPKGVGPGYTTSNTPVAVPAAPAFSLPNPFRTDLPAGLEPQYFATEMTAMVLASALGGVARLNSDPNAGGMEAVWVVDFKSSNGKSTRITWNAGELYLYYQRHAGYVVSA